jgi:hypothetical protein
LCGFELDKYVLLTLVGSTALSIVGIVNVVVKSLFPTHNR